MSARPQLLEVLAAFGMLAFLVGCPLAIFMIGTGR